MTNDLQKRFSEFVGGALAGGVLIPAAVRAISLMASSGGKSETAALDLVILVLHLTPLLQFVGTLLGLVFAFMTGPVVGVGYAVGLLGASILLQDPVFAIALVLSGVLVMAVGARRNSSGGGSRRW
jgi:hypothetical protein